MKTSSGIIVLALLLLMSGCAATWTRIDNAGRQYQDEHFRITLPVGWLRFRNKDSLILSHDGILLNNIIIEFRPHTKAFEKIEKDSSPDMLPSELAELAIAELRKTRDEGLPSLEVLSNAPIDLAGHTGFNIHLRYKTDDGLRMDILLRGLTDENGLYLIRYSAPTLYYFERDRPVYDSLTESLELAVAHGPNPSRLAYASTSHLLPQCAKLT